MRKTVVEILARSKLKKKSCLVKVSRVKFVCQFEVNAIRINDSIRAGLHQTSNEKVRSNANTLRG
jgi:hypothetical protein